MKLCMYLMVLGLLVGAAFTEGVISALLFGGAVLQLLWWLVVVPGSASQ